MERETKSSVDRSSSPYAPYRIVTERLVLRCFDPADAPRLKAAQDSSRAHCAQFLEWARGEPETLDQAVQRLRRVRAAFDSDERYAYALLSRDEHAWIGGVILQPINRFRDMDVGYWVASGHLRRGYAAEAAGALTRVALEILALPRVELRTSRDNEPSRRLACRLGFREEAVLARRIPTASGGRDDVVVYTLFAEDIAASGAGTIAYEAFDAMGAPLAWSPKRTPIA